MGNQQHSTIKGSLRDHQDFILARMTAQEWDPSS